MYSVYAVLRDKKGLSDYAVAKKCGIGRTILSDWKNGRHTPNRENLYKLAQFFDVSIEYLLTGENRTPEAQAVIDRISNNLTSISGSNILDNFIKDETFMTHIRLLWSLPDEEKIDIYKHIAALYYMSENDRKKEDALNA